MAAHLTAKIAKAARSALRRSGRVRADFRGPRACGERRVPEAPADDIMGLMGFRQFFFLGIGAMTLAAIAVAQAPDGTSASAPSPQAQPAAGATGTTQATPTQGPPASPSTPSADVKSNAGT